MGMQGQGARGKGHGARGFDRRPTRSFHADAPVFQDCDQASVDKKSKAEREKAEKCEKGEKCKKGEKVTSEGHDIEMKAVPRPGKGTTWPNQVGVGPGDRRGDRGW